MCADVYQRPRQDLGIGSVVALVHVSCTGVAIAICYGRGDERGHLACRLRGTHARHFKSTEGGACEPGSFTARAQARLREPLYLRCCVEGCGVEKTFELLMWLSGDSKSAAAANVSYRSGRSALQARLGVLLVFVKGVRLSAALAFSSQEVSLGHLARGIDAEEIIVHKFVFA
ncbi:hypothetical protein CUR178_06711 [Leishmania enriettii]|uniref:Uncharacterized protein n=1 Tax=Leishmania enriettii TaxID=5663 RepID=A0A836KPB6_LEIEN|nr:hypothetical protein CUR178_06711 [Leishmania enriettii]